MILKKDKLKITLEDIQDILNDQDIPEILIETILDQIVRKHMINEAYDAQGTV